MVPPAAGPKSISALVRFESVVVKVTIATVGIVELNDEVAVIVQEVLPPPPVPVVPPVAVVPPVPLVPAVPLAPPVAVAPPVPFEPAAPPVPFAPAPPLAPPVAVAPPV